VTAKMALTISMALHELCTNAVKYGALSVPQGRIEIAWSVQGERPVQMLRLEWREFEGPQVVPPARRGFGSRLIERQLPREFGGETRLEFEPSGVRFFMAIPLSDRATGAQQTL